MEGQPNERRKIAELLPLWRCQHKCSIMGSSGFKDLRKLPIEPHGVSTVLAMGRRDWNFRSDCGTSLCEKKYRMGDIGNLGRIILVSHRDGSV